MSCFAILAVRPADEGKSRLASVLDPESRKSFNIMMFRHVLSIVCETIPVANVIVISRAMLLLAEAREHGTHGIEERGSELNEALTQAGEAALAWGATSLLTISTDLPLLGTEDLLAMLAADSNVVIATDRERIGTNAMLVRPPFAIPYLYGGNSLAAHSIAASDRHLTLAVLDRPGLARDIDTPADLSDYRGY